MSSLGRQYRRREEQANTEPWQELQSSRAACLKHMQDMYWAGVKHEISLILLTLKEWQRPKYASVEVDGEDDLEILGFDTFVDQINEASRSFAERYCELDTARHLPATLLMVYQLPSALKAVIEMSPSFQPWKELPRIS